MGYIGQAMATGDDLRAAMSSFATGVTLITTLGDGGVVHAMTANSLTSISLDPPLVLVCVAATRHTNGFIQRSGRYTVNVLSRDQVEAARYYAKDDSERTGDPPVKFTFDARGMPVVKNCISYLDCDLVATHEHGDHAIFVGELKETGTAEGEPLIFHQRRYGGLERTSD